MCLLQLKVLSDSLGVNTCIRLSVLMRHARADDLYVVFSFIFLYFLAVCLIGVWRAASQINPLMNFLMRNT